MDCLKLNAVIFKSLSACKNALKMLELVALPFFYPLLSCQN